MLAVSGSRTVRSSRKQCPLSLVAKLNQVEREAWTDLRESRKTNGLGDPRHFNVILKAMDQRCRILGLGSQTNTYGGLPDRPFAGRTEAELIRLAFPGLVVVPAIERTDDTDD